MNAGWEILIIFLLIILNGIFTLSEISVVSSKKPRLQQRANEGDIHAQHALDLASNPSPFLSMVQVGITLIGILTGAVGGATLGDHLAPVIAQIPYS